MGGAKFGEADPNEIRRAEQSNLDGRIDQERRGLRERERE